MPCVVTREEEIAFEQNNNKKLYGVSDLTERIATRVACELGALLKKKGFLREASQLAQVWVSEHEKQDKARKELEQRILDREKMREQALAKLTPEERKLFK